MQKFVNLEPIKKEILTICKAFKLGEFKKLQIRSTNKNGFIFTEFETNKGVYHYYYNDKK